MALGEDCGGEAYCGRMKSALPRSLKALLQRAHIGQAAGALAGCLPWPSNEKVFARIYRRRGWQCGESPSGPGSESQRCRDLLDALPQLLRDLHAGSLLDAGCGDFHWMRELELDGVQYVGVDVVPPLIADNRARYGAGQRTFMLADITRDRLPACDVVLCRQCLIHLPNRQALRALRNFRRCGMRYLLATTFPAVTHNRDIWPGGFRAVNLEAAPFHLPRPLRVIEDSGPQPAVLGLWELAGLG